jgi:hypothetical protein
LVLPTTPHLTPYQLGRVHMNGPHVMVTQLCAITFSIVHFHDIVLCNVSPLDYIDVLLGIPYQEIYHAIYHSHNHQYQIWKYENTYVLTSSSLKSTTLLFCQIVVRQISLNKSISLCLVNPLKPENLSRALPSYMETLITSFEYVFSPGNKLPPFVILNIPLTLFLEPCFLMPLLIALLLVRRTKWNSSSNNFLI